MVLVLPFTLTRTCKEQGIRQQLCGNHWLLYPKYLGVHSKVVTSHTISVFRIVRSVLQFVSIKDNKM